MFSSITSVAAAPPASMASFQYRATNTAPLQVVDVEVEKEALEPDITLTEASFAERLAAERAAGYAEAESKMRHEFDLKTELQVARISEAIKAFAEQQKNYFARVESEIVQLALAISGKILHREAQVDPLLLGAIVHLALGQLNDNSSASIRVRPEEASKWRDYIASQSINISVNTVEDADLERGDCVLETELGTVNFSLDAQLKEVERGFLDVLAQKPKL